MAHRSCPGRQLVTQSTHPCRTPSLSTHLWEGQLEDDGHVCEGRPMEEDVEGQPQEHDLAKLKLLLSLTTSVTASAMFAIPQSNIEVCSQHVPSQGAAFTLKFVLVDCV